MRVYYLTCRKYGITTPTPFDKIPSDILIKAINDPNIVIYPGDLTLAKDCIEQAKIILLSRELKCDD
jgi:hypothetical protein